jgi:DNA-binding NarL/FixJ family response regulator
MSELKCLFLEHDENEIDDLLQHLQDAWVEANPAVPIRIVIKRTPKDGREALLDQSFQLLVADLWFPAGEGKDDRLAGVYFIESARKAYPQLAIIALSGAKDEEKAKATIAGADALISKKDVFGSGEAIKKMAAVMVRVLREHGHKALFAPSVLLEFSSSDWRTAAVVESIGRERIVALLAQLMKIQKIRLERVEVHHIGSGWSGAFVIGARCHVLMQLPNQSAPTKGMIPVVLKVARDGAALEDELVATERISEVAPGVIVPFPTRKVAEDEGWFGIASSQIAAGKTLFEWLPEATGSIIDEVLGRLFVQSALQNIYHNYSDADRADEVILTDLLRSRRYRVRAAYEGMRTIADRRLVKADRVMLLRVLEERDLAWLGAPEIPTRRCLSHGDLHLRNVLVDPGGTPRLIDSVNARELHWASDLARFAADVIISCWDRDDLEHDWRAFKSWRSVVMALVRNEIFAIRLPAGDRNEAPLRALKWLASNVMVIHEHVGAEWEFHAALAVEFLRASYRADAPSPKRVFGLVAAVAVFRYLNESVWSHHD